jgi:membrane protein DedA with SNARE-associated domain
METISYWISHFGYFGIFSLLLLGIFGIPVPDEWLLTFAGYLVYRHTLFMAPTVASAFLGSVCGITISYGFGRTVGLYLIHRYGKSVHITPEMIERVHDWYTRFGSWTLLFGYFLPGVRHFTAIVAGTSKLGAVPFAFFAYSGALLWSATFISLGYFLGERWAQVIEHIHHHMLVTTWLTVIGIGVYCVIRFRRKS